tara:strand:- start:53 stop:289 length:237 start_codon:yes stop_codon:yes gene_type:complete
VVAAAAENVALTFVVSPNMQGLPVVAALPNPNVPAQFDVAVIVDAIGKDTPRVKINPATEAVMSTLPLTVTTFPTLIH